MEQKKRVLDIQRAQRQLGRIRLGTVEDDGRPKKLATFRLTSNDPRALEAAAEVYGGEVRQTPEASRVRERLEVVTKTNEIEVVVSEQPVTTQYELWGKAGNGPKEPFVCLRRCDSSYIDGGVQAGQPCLCHPDPKERARLSKVRGQEQCHLVMRVWVQIPRIPDVGVWRVDSQSFYGASELPATMDGLQAFASIGMRLRAMLAIEIRQSGSKRFPVLALRIAQSMDDLKALAIEHVEGQAALGRPIAPALLAEIGIEAPSPAALAGRHNTPALGARND